MDKVIKVIIQILAALLIFIIGWFGGSLFTRRKTKKECNEAIKDLQEEHKKALKAQKQNYETKIDEKNKIIIRLKDIIERLLSLLASDNGQGKFIEESVAGRRLKHVLMTQANTLNKL